MTTSRTVQYTGPDSDFLTVLNKKHIVYVVTFEYMDYDLPTVVITPLGGGGGIALRADEVRDVNPRHLRLDTAKEVDDRSPWSRHSDARLNIVPFTVKFMEGLAREAEAQWIDDNMESLM